LFARRSSLRRVSPLLRCLWAALLAGGVWPAASLSAQTPAPPAVTPPYASVYAPALDTAVPAANDSAMQGPEAGVSTVDSRPGALEQEQLFTPARALERALGGEMPTRSSLYPSFRFSGQYDSATTDSTFNFLGSSNLYLKSRKSETILMYSGGDEAHSKLSSYDSTFHQLTISQSFRPGRWNFGVVDQFEYLPTSPYGNYSFGISYLPSQVLQNMQNSLVMLQARHYSNSSMVTVDRVFYSRWNFHVGGGYSFLEYPDSGYVNYRSSWANLDLRRQMSNRDSIALDGTASLTHFGDISAMRSYQMAVKYAHAFGRRYRLELSAGPEVTYYFASGLEQRRVITDGRAALNWTLNRSYLMLVYNHSSGAGGGILQGAESHDVQFNYTRPVARIWHVSLGLGWDRNSSISTLVSPILPYRVNSAFGSLNVERNLGRSMSLFLNYTYRYQLQDQVLLPAWLFRNHVVLAGFYWKPRPLAIR
jgi:hypothetical protein